MIEIPKTLPCYLTVNQSENYAQADHVPCDPLPHTVFKNPSLKALGEFRSFENELPVLLAWCPAMNSVHSFATTPCQWIGFSARQVSRPKFSLVTTVMNGFSVYSDKMNLSYYRLQAEESLVSVYIFILYIYI